MPACDRIRCGPVHRFRSGSVDASPHADFSARGASDERITFNEEKYKLSLKNNFMFQPHTTTIPTYYFIMSIFLVDVKTPDADPLLSLAVAVIRT